MQAYGGGFVKLVTLVWSSRGGFCPDFSFVVLNWGHLYNTINIGLIGSLSTSQENGQKAGFKDLGSQMGKWRFG